MPHSPSLEQAKAYLDIHLTRPLEAHRAGSTHSEAPFITISRESGSGGSTLARLLVERLNADRKPTTETVAWTVFDQELVEHVLADEHLSPRLARFIPEDKVSELNASVGEIVGLHPNLWTLIQKTSALMRELARRGRVILVGRGSNFATAGLHGGIHVRLVASPEHRAHHMAALLNIGFEEAMVHNRRVDAARRDYVRSVFDADVANPAAYDLVTNTGKISHEAAARIVAGLVHEPSGVRSGMLEFGDFRAAVGRTDVPSTTTR